MFALDEHSDDYVSLDDELFASMDGEDLEKLYKISFLG
jgi:hypothetical protein